MEKLDSITSDLYHLNDLDVFKLALYFLKGFVKIKIELNPFKLIG